MWYLLITYNELASLCYMLGLNPNIETQTLFSPTPICVLHLPHKLNGDQIENNHPASFKSLLMTLWFLLPFEIGFIYLFIYFAFGIMYYFIIPLIHVYFSHHQRQDPISVSLPSMLIPVSFVRIEANPPLTSHTPFQIYFSHDTNHCLT